MAAERTNLGNANGRRSNSFCEYGFNQLAE